MNHQELPIIDLPTLEHLVGGNKDTAQEMLALFMQELPVAKQHITDAFQQADWVMLQYHLHRLHGALCYSGALRLKAFTKDFEAHVRSAQGEYNAEYAQLMKEMDRTAEEYRRMVDDSSHL